ncbi:hypothetical protein [Rhizobium sp. SAFR-030]|uniref:hypothetical protein n=1 Tax=Rhizobium sp. SAFR-030 TaxID=3387277 RepID=UPI003F7E5296
MDKKQNTLAEFQLPTMKMICTRCERRGRYDVERLKQRFGAEAPIHQVIDAIADCPRKKLGRCGAGCDDLVWMFQPAPFGRHWPQE